MKGLCFITILCAIVACAAHASEAVPDPKKNALVPWADKEKYQACGAGCLYKKGNENLSMQAVYSLDKVKELERLRVEDPTAFDDAMDGFCLATEDDEQCLERYKLKQIEHIRQVRASIGKNGISEGKLAYKPDKSGAIIVESSKEEEKLKKQTTHVLSLQDIQKYNSGVCTGNDCSTDVPREPTIDEFVQFKSVDRDPKDKAAGSFLVVDDSDTAKKKQKEAFKKAHDAYKAAIGAHEKNQKEWQKQSQRMAASKKDLSEAEKRAFINARNSVVEVANTATEGVQKLTEEQKKKEAARKPAEKGPAEKGDGQSTGDQQKPNAGSGPKGGGGNVQVDARVDAANPGNQPSVPKTGPGSLPKEIPLVDPKAGGRGQATIIFHPHDIDTAVDRTIPLGP